MKHPSKREQQRLFKLMENLDFLFGVQTLDRTLCFKEQDRDDGTTADVTCDYAYQRLSINIYPLFWKQTRKEQREMILHEYCHTVSRVLNDLICDLREGKFVSENQRKDAWEEVTSRTANLVDGLLRGRNKYARDAYAKYLK